MKRKEFSKKFKEAESQRERDRLAEEFWDTHARIRFIVYATIIILILTILWIVLWLFIRLVRFIAF